MRRGLLCLAWTLPLTFAACSTGSGDEGGFTFSTSAQDDVGDGDGDPTATESGSGSETDSG